MEMADAVIQPTRKPLALAFLGLVVTAGCGAHGTPTGNSTQQTTAINATASSSTGGQTVANVVDPQTSPAQGTGSSVSSHPSTPTQPSSATKSSQASSSSVPAPPPQSASAVKPVSITSKWTWKAGQEQYANQTYVPLTLALHMNPPSSSGYKVGTSLDFAITLADDGAALVTLSEPLALEVQVQRLNKGAAGPVFWEAVLPSTPTTIGIGTINLSWKQTDSTGQPVGPGTYQASLKTPIPVSYTPFSAHLGGDFFLHSQPTGCDAALKMGHRRPPVKGRHHEQMGDIGRGMVYWGRQRLVTDRRGR